MHAKFACKQSLAAGLYLLEVSCRVIWYYQKYSAFPSIPFYYSLMLPALQTKQNLG